MDAVTSIREISRWLATNSSARDYTLNIECHALFNE